MFRKAIADYVEHKQNTNKLRGRNLDTEISSSYSDSAEDSNLQRCYKTSNGK